jgi:sulfatase maturation enzyme AslB (radical SAM superfamily)
MLKLFDIRKIHVELTTRCNARCPMCMRNYQGYDYNSGYPLTELTLQQFKHIVTPTLLKQLTNVLFNGNLGDFGLARDAQEIVKYIVEHDVKVSIMTNGSVRTPAWWAELAMPGVEIGFALDGLEDTHSLYRQDTNWHSVIANAQSFIQAGGRAIWRFIPFDHNRHQIDQCKKLAKDMGFSSFIDISDGRDRTLVYHRNGEYSHRIGEMFPGEVKRTPPPVKDLLKSHVTWFDHRTVVNEKDTTPFDFICEHIRQQELYIAADGTVYPCCFLGFYPTSMHHPGNSQLKDLVQENNALEYGLEHAIQWFEKVQDTWSRASIAEGRLYHCVDSCGGRSTIKQKNLL